MPASFLVLHRRRRRIDLQVQQVAGRLNTRLVHRLHVGRADGKASRVDDLEQIEGFMAATKLSGENGRAVIEKFASRIPVLPGTWLLQKLVAVLVLHEFRSCGNWILDQQVLRWRAVHR